MVQDTNPPVKKLHFELGSLLFTFNFALESFTRGRAELGSRLKNQLSPSPPGNPAE